MLGIGGSNTYPGLQQRINLLLGPSQAGQNERILLIGFRDAAADDSFDNAPQKMITESDGVALFGEGSQLALMVRSAFAVGPLARLDTQTRGFQPEIWAMAVPPPVGVEAVNTITFAGPATASQAMPVEIGGQRVLVQVVAGNTADDIAAKVNTAILGVERNLPFTTGVAAAVVTLTGRAFGVHLNELFVWADARRVPGVTAVSARTVEGTGVVALTAALTASEAGDWAVVVVNQEDDATRDAIKPHVQAMWDETVQRRRRVIMPHGGLLTEASSDAQAIDDWRAAVASVERRIGVSAPWDPAHSARAFSWEGAAAYGARLESQRRTNYSFNLATLPTRGRPSNTLTGAEYDAGHNAGVTIITDDPGGAAPGIITDPISTATTDQTGVTNATDRTFLPLEFPRVVRRVSADHAISDAGFAQANSVSDEATRRDIKASGLDDLNEATRRGEIQPVSDADVFVVFSQEGGSEVATRTETYFVVVGLDRIRIIHNVGRAIGA